MSETELLVFKFGLIEIKIPKENSLKQWEMTKNIIDIFFQPLGETQDRDVL